MSDTRDGRPGGQLEAQAEGRPATVAPPLAYPSLQGYASERGLLKAPAPESQRGSGLKAVEAATPGALL